MSLIKRSDSLQESASYRPEIGNEIWDGFISFDPLYPSGEEWAEFSQKVHDEQYANLPANASIPTTVALAPTTAGIAWANFYEYCTNLIPAKIQGPLLLT